MKTTLFVLFLSLLVVCAQPCDWCGVYECQYADIILDLRSDGTAELAGLKGRTWKELKEKIEVYTGATLEATFKKEGQDLIREGTGTRYLKVREFEQ